MTCMFYVQGAIVSFTKGLAQALMPQGIRVNAVAPGPVWTPLVVSSFPEDAVRFFRKQLNGLSIRVWALVHIYWACLVPAGRLCFPPKRR